MDDWLQRYGAALADELPAGFDAALGEDARETLLELARVVAHGSERRNAPLATFLAGRFVTARVAQGATVLAAVQEALAVAERLTD